MRWWPVLMWALWACDGDRAGGADARVSGDSGRADLGRDATQDAADARVNDAVVRDARAPGDLDALRPDARGLDAAVVDVGMLDRGAADAAVPDAAMVDARAPDAAMVDARVPDAAADQGPPPACVGIRLPPPPESPDGSEVCNYRDDDGDGLVDEGFPYDFIGEPVQVTGRLEPGQNELKLTWSGDGYGVSWTTAWGLRFLTLDAAGCPISAVMQIDQNPEGQPFLPDSHDMAYVGGRYAAVFTQQRRLVEGSPGGFGTFVQLFDRAGQPVGALVDLDPTLSHLGFNAIVPFNDQFAVFSTAYHPQRGGLSYSAFAIFDRDGRIVQGPSHPYDALPGRGQGMDTFIGLAYDGEGFGMAWHGVGNWFMRWSPAGEVLTPPAEPDEIGYYGRTSGIAWTGQHYVIPNDGLDNRHLGLGFVTPDLQQRFAVEVGDNDVGTQTLDMFSANGQLFHYGAFSGVFFSRLDPLGELIGPRLRTDREQWIGDFAPVSGGPLATISARVVDPEVSNEIAVFFSRVGCRTE